MSGSLTDLVLRLVDDIHSFLGLLDKISAFPDEIGALWSFGVPQLHHGEVNNDQCFYEDSLPSFFLSCLASGMVVIYFFV